MPRNRDRKRELFQDSSQIRHPRTIRRNNCNNSSLTLLFATVNMFGKVNLNSNHHFLGGKKTSVTICNLCPMLWQSLNFFFGDHSSTGKPILPKPAQTINCQHLYHHLRVANMPIMKQVWSDFGCENLLGSFSLQLASDHFGLAPHIAKVHGKSARHVRHAVHAFALHPAAAFAASANAWVWAM